MKVNNYDGKDPTKMIKYSKRQITLRCGTNATIFLLPNYFNKSEYVYQHKTGDAKQNSAILTEKSSDFYDIK